MEKKLFNLSDLKEMFNLHLSEAFIEKHALVKPHTIVKRQRLYTAEQVKQIANAIISICGGVLNGIR